MSSSDEGDVDSSDSTSSDENDNNDTLRGQMGALSGNLETYDYIGLCVYTILLI